MSDDSTYAATPFDHAKADIILCSSDNVHFRVFKLFLSLASPFFETLFDISQPTDENGDQEVKDGLAVISVTEDSKTLDTLLRFCYPCTLAEDPKIEVLKDAMDILEATRRYSLDTIEKKARQVIASPKILEAQPLGCFAIAHRGRLREETILAARHTLTQPLIPSRFEEIELLTATDLLSLLTYHKKCGDAVYALRLDLSWIKSYYGSSGACFLPSGKPRRRTESAWGRLDIPSEADSTECTCQSGSEYALFGVSLDWWENFMKGTFVALHDKPCRETVQACADKTVQAVKARNCKVCSPKVTEGMRGLVDLFTKKIEETVSQIELELSF